ncbi:unnamed protein product [Caretta caretta]
MIRSWQQATCKMNAGLEKAELELFLLYLFQLLRRAQFIFAVSNLLLVDQGVVCEPQSQRKLTLLLPWNKNEPFQARITQGSFSFVTVFRSMGSLHSVP